MSQEGQEGRIWSGSLFKTEVGLGQMPQVGIKEPSHTCTQASDEGEAAQQGCGPQGKYGKSLLPHLILLAPDDYI